MFDGLRWATSSPKRAYQQLSSCECSAGGAVKIEGQLKLFIFLNEDMLDVAE